MEELIDLLSTPCGEILIVDEYENRIPFSLRKNTFDVPYEFESVLGETISASTETNYEMVIKTSSLRRGMMYRIFLRGTALHFGDSDERTECVSGCSNGYCIAIGAYSPNDDEKLSQAYAYSENKGYLNNKIIQMPPEFDESKFIEYDVVMLDDKSGFCFHLIDEQSSEITFLVAWIKCKTGDETDYESAVQFWTT